MGLRDKVRPTHTLAIGSGALFCSLLLTGCGTPGAPQPPSLKLPEKVVDLQAERAGDIVNLQWTAPRKNTDRLLIKGSIEADICRCGEVTEKPSIPCQRAGVVSVDPGETGSFSEALPADLTTGPARRIIYFVELKNHRGHSAGLSNGAIILAGAAPSAVKGLAAEVRADGVALHWEPSADSATALVRLHRKLLNPPLKEQKADNGVLSAPPEAILRDLIVEAPQAGKTPGALDSSAQFGSDYEYTAQRVNRITADGKTFELSGPNSEPIRVNVVDNFPPAVPTGLAAVFSSDDKAIDLSWQPDTESDLAGYIVYRAENEGDWKRISPVQPITGPSYRDVSVEPAHIYRYAVTAIDTTGHESKRSQEATESVPAP
jgi:hypothetical protein